MLHFDHFRDQRNVSLRIFESLGYSDGVEQAHFPAPYSTIDIAFNLTEPCDRLSARVHAFRGRSKYARP
jgi:hypothetical protein